MVKIIPTNHLSD